MFYDGFRSGLITKQRTNNGRVKCFCLCRHPNETCIYSSRLEPDERRRGRERGRDRREKHRDSDTGRSSRRHSAASFYTQVSFKKQQIPWQTLRRNILFVLFVSMKTSDGPSEKHKALKVKERSHSARPQTQVSTD